LWERVEASDLVGFLRYAAADQNARHFDGIGALALLMAMYGPALRVRRNYHEQWFTPQDASVVSFSSGTLALVSH
jgi:hypothetical protein